MNIIAATDKELGVFKPVKIPCGEKTGDLLDVCKLKGFHSILLKNGKRIDVINKKLKKWIGFKRYMHFKGSIISTIFTKENPNGVQRKRW